MNSRKRRLSALVLSCATAGLLLAATPAHAGALMKKHWYSCYAQGTYVTWIDIKRNSKYVTDWGPGAEGQGTYAHNPDRARIRWKSGPLEGYSSKHLGMQDGSDVIAFFFKGGEYTWTCYNDGEL